MTMTLGQISDEMRKIDFCMLSTRTENGAIASRPMSNNGEVEYDGDSYFFAYDSARFVSEISADANVGLTFAGTKGLFGAPPHFIAVEGKARLVRDKSAFAARWTSDLDRWFPEGAETPGLVMVEVHAGRLHYWNGEDEGELKIA